MVAASRAWGLGLRALPTGVDSWACLAEPATLLGGGFDMLVRVCGLSCFFNDLGVCRLGFKRYGRVWDMTIFYFLREPQTPWQG